MAPEPPGAEPANAVEARRVRPIARAAVYCREEARNGSGQNRVVQRSDLAPAKGRGLFISISPSPIYGRGDRERAKAQ
jgi:hypothetical protein